ncbi:hypothetical protein [Halobellus sp. GM3]|uniref:hypothetical protein n=1 Tax=Halobellus sp. GM3 TaxID=3458410 RepID=UPI00403E044B
MVPDDPPRASARVDADDPPGDVGDATYDLIYRATREAIWDVLGTATLILFYLALTAICLSVAVGGIGPFLRGSASYVALAVGLIALVAGVFALFRVYRLVTE